MCLYSGDAPWTHAPLQEFDAGFDTWWVPGHVKATESFLLFASDDNFAVGVYNSGNDVENIIAGFFGEKGSGGENDNPTGYMAPSGQVSLAWNEQYTYEYCLIMGNIDTVRNYVYQLHESEVLHGSNGLKKHFNIDVELAPAANVQPSAINSNKTRVSGIHGVEASLIPHGIAKK